MVTADTNVFVYSLDPQNPAKQTAAKQIVGELMHRNAIIGLQCIGELQNALRRKLKLPAWEAAQHARNLLIRFETFPPTEVAAERALGDLYVGRGSYFDRLLIYSAGEAGCTVFITEDAQGAPVIQNVEIVAAFGAEGVMSERARQVLEL